MPPTHSGEQVISISLFISSLSIIIGMLIIGLAIPLIRGKIPMNDTYGLRIPKSFTSEENWYKLNTFGSKIMIAFLSVVILSIAFCLYLIFQFAEKLS
jgi:uncharacterized membrane protein